MVIGAPWADTYLEPQQKEQTSLMFISQLPTIHQNILNFRNCLEVNQCIDCDILNHKNVNFATIFHNPVGEKNPYVRFGYVPLTIF